MKTGQITIKRNFAISKAAVDFMLAEARWILRAQYVRLQLTVASNTARGSSFMQQGVHSEQYFCGNGDFFVNGKPADLKWILLCLPTKLT